MRSNTRIYFAVALLVLGTTLLASQEFDATVSKITGKVEIQTAKGWTAAKTGQKLPAGTTVSTGFRSELQLKIGASLLTVKPLSRLTIRDIAKKEGIANTDLYLKVGKVSVDVKPVDGADQKFKVESPVSTASVRGTAFEFDGETLTVSKGLVQFSDLRGIKIDVPVGESAKAPPANSTKEIMDNQNLITDDSITGTDAGDDYGQDAASSEWFDLSLDGFDSEDLYDVLSSYDWENEIPNSYLTLYGIVQ